MRTAAVRAGAERRGASVLAAVGAAVVASVPPGAGEAAQESPATHLLVVSGLSGEPAYAEAFHRTALRLLEAAGERAGLPADRVVWLAEDPARAPGRVSGRSTREELEGTLRELAGRAGPGDVVILVLLGHGSLRGEEPTLALPGPDLSAAELAVMLDGLGERTVAVVNAASASGAFVPGLAAEGRVVITATRSATERNATRFGGFFAEALAGDDADADKDGRVSLLEAFEYARREVARSYEEENRLQTEHALLEDDGDGRGSLEPDPGSGDGSLARRVHLSAGPAAAVAAAAAEDPELAALLERRRELEAEIDALRDRREAMERAAYERRLEELLVELSLTSREIREREEER